MTNHNKFKENYETISINNGKTPSLINRFKNLLGVGPYLLLLGLFIEILTIFFRRWISFTISLSSEMQIILTILCIAVFLSGMIWFNHSLNLIKVNLVNEKRELITHGPFNYVRHPLYSTLLLTIPPMLIIWLSDLLLIIPWVALFVLSHYIVTLEELELIKIFGDNYKKYQRFVPALLPFKGNGGKLYRKHYNESL